MAEPMKPTAKKVEEHEITHLLYRRWCWACVQGRGKGVPRRRGREQGTLPEVRWDFTLVGLTEEPGETIPRFAAREIISRMHAATAVPTKSVDQFVVKRVIAFLAEVGCLRGDVIARSDQEPGMTSLVDERQAQSCSWRAMGRREQHRRSRCMERNGRESRSVSAGAG